MSPRAGSIAAATLVLLLAGTAPALAARTDVIVLVNGDRITGEVIRMRQGILTVKTDDLGTISIEWDVVASITTAQHYDVTTRDGAHLFGRLRPGTAGSVEVAADGGITTSVASAEIVSLAAVKTRFWQRIDGSLDLGGSYTQSSGVAQLTFETDAVYRRPSYVAAAAVSMNFTRQPDQPETSRHSVNLDYTRFRADGWLVSWLALLERNEELGFTFRGTGAGSVGRYLARSNRAEFLLAGGFAAGRESPVDAPTVTNVDLLVIADWSVFIYDRPSMRVDVGLLLFPSLDDPGRVRANATSKFKRELFKDFHFTISVYDAFDNRPKATVAQENDFGGSLAFGWTF